MAIGKHYFEEYCARFPPEHQSALVRKLAYKRSLESDKRFKIPVRIWLAFLTPPSPEAGRCVRAHHKKVVELKRTMLEIFDHPKKFLDTRDPLHRTSECVTLALLEILYDLSEHKVLLERQRYEEWLDVANHFGLWKLRYLLEDAIFKTFDPDNYALFESVVQKQLFIDEHLVQAIRGIISDALTRGGLSGFSIENRAKNIYGVYRKVALKEKSVNDIYDIHGFRILTATERDCRTAIEILHRLWRHYPERFKDYIAEPKPNGYQSIHTVLNCLENKPIEFQVRTRDMDVVAASGPANHAEYKRTARLSR